MVEVRKMGVSPHLAATDYVSNSVRDPGDFDMCVIQSIQTKRSSC